MKALDDTVMLEDVSPADVRDCLVDATNLAWKAHGEAARCSVPATFLGWLIQEHDRLREEADALRSQDWDALQALRNRAALTTGDRQP